jgi:AcrR family transcriptional regulator
MEKTRREQRREDTINEIKAVARQLMSEGGTNALSMRPIAAKLNMSVMGLYRYFENRDALITALVADNFNALADALETARDNEPSDDPRKKLWAVLMAYHNWAIEYPIDFQLNYGNPIPGYVAPREITVPAVVRSFKVTVGLIEEMLQKGLANPPPPYDRVPSYAEAAIQATIENDGYPISPLALYLGVVGWGQLHGVIILELFDHIQALINSGPAHYEQQVKGLLYMLGVEIP